MEFCKDCGGVLNLFGNDTSELCSSCIQHAKPVPVAPEPQPLPSDETDILLETTLSCENGKIILHSKEGWQLWSGPAEKKTNMADILKSAKLIYKIRTRRKAKK
jgi:hypothetical protein